MTQATRCPHCGAANPGGYRFCTECAKPPNRAPDIAADSNADFAQLQLGVRSRELAEGATAIVELGLVSLLPLPVDAKVVLACEDLDPSLVETRRVRLIPGVPQELSVRVRPRHAGETIAEWYLVLDSSAGLASAGRGESRLWARRAAQPQIIVDRSVHVAGGAVAVDNSGDVKLAAGSLDAVRELPPHWLLVGEWAHVSLSPIALTEVAREQAPPAPTAGEPTLRALRGDATMRHDAHHREFTTSYGPALAALEHELGRWRDPIDAIIEHALHQFPTAEPRPDAITLRANIGSLGARLSWEVLPIALQCHLLQCPEVAGPFDRLLDGEHATALDALHGIAAAQGNAVESRLALAYGYFFCLGNTQAANAELAAASGAAVGEPPNVVSLVVVMRAALADLAAESTELARAAASLTPWNPEVAALLEARSLVLARHSARAVECLTQAVERMPHLAPRIQQTDTLPRSLRQAVVLSRANEQRSEATQRLHEAISALTRLVEALRTVDTSDARAHLASLAADIEAVRHTVSALVSNDQATIAAAVLRASECVDRGQALAAHHLDAALASANAEIERLSIPHTTAPTRSPGLFSRLIGRAGAEPSLDTADALRTVVTRRDRLVRARQSL